MQAGASHRIVIVLHPDVAATDVAGPMDAFGLANMILGRPWYDPVSVSLDGAPVRVAGSFMQIVPTYSFDTLPGRIDTLLVAGGPAAATAASDPDLVAALRSIAPRCTRIASICTGAFILCATGLADGEQVATHWSYVSALQERFPQVQVDGDAVFLRNGTLWSSGGMTTAIDLALAMIEADLGRHTALAVARQLAIYVMRSGRHQQFSPQLRAQHVDDPAIERVQHLILDNLSGALRIEDLAAQSRLSVRSLQRAFPASVGMPIRDFILHARLRLACELLTTSDRTLKEIALMTGTGTAANLRRLFLRHLGTSPTAYRGTPPSA